MPMERDILFILTLTPLIQKNKNLRCYMRILVEFKIQISLPVGRQACLPPAYRLPIACLSPACRQTGQTGQTGQAGQAGK